MASCTVRVSGTATATAGWDAGPVVGALVGTAPGCVAGAVMGAVVAGPGTVKGMVASGTMAWTSGLPCAWGVTASSVGSVRERGPLWPAPT